MQVECVAGRRAGHCEYDKVGYDREPAVRCVFRSVHSSGSRGRGTGRDRLQGLLLDFDGRGHDFVSTQFRDSRPQTTVRLPVA